jgi:hypothetical protein
MREHLLSQLGEKMFFWGNRNAGPRKITKFPVTGVCKTHKVSKKPNGERVFTSMKCETLPQCFVMKFVDETVPVTSLSCKDKKTLLPIPKKISLLESKLREKTGKPWCFDRFSPLTLSERVRICKRNQWFNILQLPEGTYRVLPNRDSLNFYNKQFWLYYEIKSFLSLIFVNEHVQIKDLVDIRSIVLRYLGNSTKDLTTLQRRLLNLIHFYIRRANKKCMVRSTLEMELNIIKLPSTLDE